MPGVDHEVVGRVAQAYHHQLGDVAAKQVQRPRRGVVAHNRPFASVIVDLLRATGELGISLPALVRVVGAGVDCVTRIALKIERLDRVRHAPEPHFPLGENDLAAADAGRTVPAERGERKVLVSLEKLSSGRAQLGCLGFDVAPTRHGRHAISIAVMTEPFVAGGTPQVILNDKVRDLQFTETTMPWPPAA